MTHCSRLKSLFSTRPSVGRATFTTVLSRMTMNVPMMIAMSGIRIARVVVTDPTVISRLRHSRARFYFCPYGQVRPCPNRRVDNYRLLDGTLERTWYRLADDGLYCGNR